MHILLNNFHWMTINIILAIIPVIAGEWALKIKNSYFKAAFFVIWVLFLPNAIYLFTDIYNFLNQWHIMNFNQKLVLIFQYAVLESFAIVTTIIALYPLEKYLLHYKKWSRKKAGKIIILVNIMVAFGITLGRVQRVNSWEAITSPMLVINSSITILTSPKLIALTALFALFANCYYFLFKKYILKFVNTYLGPIAS